jgi:G3E family GTPase
MPNPRLILVGGFLGAGKTTLLQRAAMHLADQGLHVGLITNDQAPDLVDTHWLRQRQLGVQEVAGSCFCCNFPALLDAARSLTDELRADLLIAEPVGSCTDLSATILQPLKDLYHQDFAVSPLTVLCDPHRLRSVLDDSSGLHPSAAYIYQRQLAEADFLAVSKSDLLDEPQRRALHELLQQQFPDTPVHWLSGRTGDGVAEWLDQVRSTDAAGQRIVDVDYDTYAEGEAVLGWFNAEYKLSATDCCLPDWHHLAHSLMDQLLLHFQARNSAIGHVKLFMSSGDDELLANVTTLSEEPEYRGELDGAAPNVRLILNARVQMSPQDLERIATDTLSAVAGCATLSEVRRHSLQPGRPEPTHRYAEVIQ